MRFICTVAGRGEWLCAKSLVSSFLQSFVVHVCYYWLHESHVTFMVSDLKKRDDLTRVGGWKDVKEGTILSRSSLFRAPTPPRLLSYAYILRTLVDTVRRTEHRSKGL